MRKGLAAMRTDQRGATAVEYGLILALLVIAVLAGIKSLGGGTATLWNGVHDKVIAAT